MVPKPTTHNTQNIRQIPADVEPVSPRTNAVQQVDGSSDIAQGLQDTPQLAWERYEELRQLFVNSPDIETHLAILNKLKEKISDPTPEMNESFDKAYLYFVLNATPEDPSLLPKAAKAIQDPVMNFQALNRVVTSVKLDESILNQARTMSETILNAMLSMPTPCTYNIYPETVTIGNATIKDDASGIIIEGHLPRPSALMGGEMGLHEKLKALPEPFRSKIYRQLVDEVMNVTSFDRYSNCLELAREIKHCELRKEALINISSLPTTCDRDFLILLKVYDLLPQGAIEPNLKNLKKQALEKYLDSQLSKKEELSNLFYLVHQDPLSTDQEAQKIVLKKIAACIHEIQGGPQGRTADRMPAIELYTKIYTFAANMQLSQADSCSLKKELMEILLDNTECHQQVKGSVVAHKWIPDKWITSDIRIQILKKFANASDITYKMKQNVFNELKDDQDKDLKKTLLEMAAKYQSAV